MYEKRHSRNTEGIFNEWYKTKLLKIAKQFNCDARTVKRYFLNCQHLKRKPRVVVKVLDAYEELVIEKLDLGANAYLIFNFIKKTRL